MFSGLSSYFFGSSTTEEGEDNVQEQQESTSVSPPRKSPSPKRRTKSPSCGLKTVAAAEGDEWMLVDKTSSCGGTPVMGRSLTEGDLLLHSTPQLATDTPPSPIYLPLTLPLLPHYCAACDSSRNNSMNSSQTTDSETRLKVDELSDHDDSDTVLSDISSLPERVVHPSMDESWLVTPPPCFTVGGNSPLRLVSTNPLENLLIEHTSMSVYGPRGRPSSRGHESDEGSESSGHHHDLVEGPSNRKKVRAVTALPPRRPKAVALRAGLEAQVHSLKSMQKSKQKKEGRHLNRSNLNRSNKVQHISGRQQQQRRKQYMLRPSGACNDRKSQ